MTSTVGKYHANVKTRIRRGGFAVQPLTMAQDINAQLTTWFSQRLAGFSDEVVVTPVHRPPATELRAASLQHDGQREAVGQRQCGGALRQ